MNVCEVRKKRFFLASLLGLLFLKLGVRVRSDLWWFGFDKLKSLLAEAASVAERRPTMAERCQQLLHLLLLQNVSKRDGLFLLGWWGRIYKSDQ